MDLQLIHAAAAGLVLVATWVLAATALFAFVRARQARLLMACGAFVALAARATWTGLAIAYGDVTEAAWWGTGTDAAVAVLLFASFTR